MYTAVSSYSDVFASSNLILLTTHIHWYPLFPLCVAKYVKVPKSVGRTDDEFQRYRSRTLNASIEEVKLAELFTVSGYLFTFTIQWVHGHVADSLCELRWKGQCGTYLDFIQPNEEGRHTIHGCLLTFFSA